MACVPTIVFRATSGNVIGVVEKPDTVDLGVPLAQQCSVKIGVLDRRGPLPREDARNVISRLLQFARTL